MRSRIALILIFTLIIGLLPGCGQKAENRELTPVTVILDWFPNTNHTGLYVAKEKGFYEEEGLEVKIVNPGEGGTAQLIAAGKGDFGISYQEEVTYARAEDIPVVAIAAVIQHNTSGFASPADRNIKNPKDFEGKTYGGWGSPMENAMLKALMDKYGADFSKVNIINIGTADFFTSLEKDIDFAWIYYGWTGIEAELKNIPLNFIKLRDEHEALDFYTPVIITSEEKIKNNPELVKKFMRATARGYQFSIENPEQAAAILLKAAPELNSQLVKKSQQYLAAEYQADAPRWGEMKKEVWQKFADFMYQNGLIKKNIDPAKAFTNEFLP
ncbi:ABC-type nitrate/sulfonate/bicarbonate transport system, substrate-binding protein [Thermosyntropha lipolytica DSM 11003]|uniref:ABC-type nitrate/sulfonate/bicarbonate transport system, substrate-binding protein n=1 Tax=Thermosyntropha lipolytica DSM 11003 TaxID=1123382 RepID=A0A1M5M2C2_9FIRM|nr:ABC transporter substrate-binding protein [Thermosyntropha lipolytica]SHG71474.1 ABC-type nitrate/sulfonate/bicarbonate transport system, substrate-binding protein [Thermosyntropha lipolytica DSM 11003]